MRHRITPPQGSVFKLGNGWVWHCHECRYTSVQMAAKYVADWNFRAHRQICP